MSNLFESMPPCIWFEGGDKRNAIASLVSGLLFFTGIWLAIDANSTHPESFKGAYHLCGIVGTLSLIIMEHALALSQLAKDVAKSCKVIWSRNFPMLSTYSRPVALINLVSNTQLQGDSYSGGFLGPRGARLWLFVGFVLGFAAVIASCWLLFSEFVGNDQEKDNMWVGAALFLQNAFILGASLVFKFGRVEDPWG